MAFFIKEVNSGLAKRPLVFNGRLANRGLTSLVKEATVGVDALMLFFSPMRPSNIYIYPRLHGAIQKPLILLKLNNIFLFHLYHRNICKNILTTSKICQHKWITSFIYGHGWQCTSIFVKVIFRGCMQTCGTELDAVLIIFPMQMFTMWSIWTGKEYLCDDYILLISINYSGIWAIFPSR